MLNAGSSAVVIAVNCLFGKAFMSVFFRMRQMSGAVFGGKKREEAKRMEDTPFYKFASRSQLNEAEWSAPSLAILLFLHSQNVEAKNAANLIAFGSIWFLWTRLLGGPKAVTVSSIGAVCRYMGFIQMIHQLYLVVF